MNQELEKQIRQILRKSFSIKNANDVPVCTLILNSDLKIISSGTNNNYKNNNITGNEEINAINKPLTKRKSLN